MSGTPTLPLSEDERQFPDVRDVDFDLDDAIAQGAPLESVAAIADRVMSGSATVTIPLTADPVDTVKVVETKAGSFLERLKAHQITDDASFLACDGLFTAAKGMLDEIDATFNPIIAAANKAHKEAIAQRKKHAGPIEEALANLKRLFLTEKSRRDRQAEEERLRAEAVVRQEIETATTEIVDELRAEGRDDEAETVIEQAKATSVAPLMPASTVVNKLQNVSTSGTWKLDETAIDLMTLVKAVAAGKAPIQCLKADTVYLNKRASADKSALNIPGVKAVFVPTVRVRRSTT